MDSYCGAYGCLLSHVAGRHVKRTIQRAELLIFEDDAVLDPDFQEQFARFFKKCPTTGTCCTSARFIKTSR